MPDAAVDVLGSVFKESTGTFLWQVYGWDGTLINQASVASLSYTVYLLADDPEAQPDTRTAVDGHEDVALDKTAVVFDAGQVDALWDELDAVGYNLRVTIDRSANEAFAIAGRYYLVEVRLVMASGQDVVVRSTPKCR